MPLYNVEALNLRSRNVGEADKLVTLFSKEFGKIPAIAKGSRRPGSKFGGRLEIFTYNQILLATAKTWDIISQCETIESFFRLREDREKLNAGVHMIKLIDMVTEERQRNDELFGLLLDGLYALQGAANADMLLRAFEVKLCDIEGFLPSDEMLSREHERLPMIANGLKVSILAGMEDMKKEDLKIAGKFFSEVISDHTGNDMRRLKEVI